MMAKIPQIETVDDLLHVTGLALRSMAARKPISQLRLTGSSRPTLITEGKKWYSAMLVPMQQLAEVIDQALQGKPQNAGELYWALRLGLRNESRRLMGGDSPLPKVLNPAIEAGDLQEFSKLLKLLSKLGGKA